MKLVSVEARQYGEIDYGNYKAKMGPRIRQWLKDRGIEPRAESDFGWEDPDEGTRALDFWAVINNSWLTFKWNDHDLADEFKNHFTNWNPSHQYPVVVEDTSQTHREIMGSEMAAWMKEYDLADSGDYSVHPHFSNANITRKPQLCFEFRDPKIAMLFKLTFGGESVQSLI